MYVESLFPNIYIFNPTCEYAVANGIESWQPNRILQKMEFDLSALPMYFAKSNDFVVVNQIPSDKFLETLNQFQVVIPQFVLKDKIHNPDFINLPKDKLLPWGWSPAMHKYLALLKPSCSDEFKQSSVFHWLTEHRDLYSRKFALQILKQLSSKLNSGFIIPQQSIAKVCTTQNEIEKLVQEWGNLMVKAPWSSSGRGLQPITKTPIHTKVWEKLLAIIRTQGYVLVEPLLNKVLDYAFEFKLQKGEVEFLGISHFTTNNKGQYEGNYLNGLPGNLDKRIVEFADFTIKEIRSPLIKTIENSDLAKLYEGIFGVDVLIYSDENNELEINPCLEINLRHNMGILSLEIEKLILPNKKGMFRTFYQPGKSFFQFKKEMEIQHPLIVTTHKIESGFLALTEALETTQFGTYVLIQ